MSANNLLALFRIGRIVATPNALERLSQDDIFKAIGRHQSGDWGDVGEHDREANNRALKDRSRLLSVYHSATGVKFWIITEADRSATAILLPRDY